MDVPALRRLRFDAARSGVERKVRDEDGEPPDGELAAPVARDVDAVEALKIGFYGVGVIAEEADELRQFPATPTAF